VNLSLSCPIWLAILSTTSSQPPEINPNHGRSQRKAGRHVQRRPGVEALAAPCPATKADQAIGDFICVIVSTAATLSPSVSSGHDVHLRAVKKRSLRHSPPLG
jgi:hypothetical protein